MICPTLSHLYQICTDPQSGFSPTDLIRVACRNCQVTEVCPAMGAEEYDARESTTQVKRSVGRPNN